MHQRPITAEREGVYVHVRCTPHLVPETVEQVESCEIEQALSPQFWSNWLVLESLVPESGHVTVVLSIVPFPPYKCMRNSLDGHKKVRPE